MKNDYCLSLVLLALFGMSSPYSAKAFTGDNIPSTQSTLQAKKIKADGSFEIVGSEAIRKGERVLVEAGDTIPNDGEVIDGMRTITKIEDLSTDSTNRPKRDVIIKRMTLLP